MEVDMQNLPIVEDAPELAAIVRDRALPDNVRYPMDHGLAPSTVSAGGEPRFDDARTPEDLPGQNLREIEQSFVTCERLERDEEAEVQGWHGPKEAPEIIRKWAG